MYSSKEIHHCVQDILDNVKTFEHDYKHDYENKCFSKVKQSSRNVYPQEHVYPLLHYVSRETPQQTVNVHFRKRDPKEMHNYAKGTKGTEEEDKRKTNLGPFSKGTEEEDKRKEETIGLIGASMISIGGTFLLANDSYIRIHKQQLNSKIRELNVMSVLTEYNYDAFNAGVAGEKWLDVFKPRTKKIAISKFGAITSSLYMFGGLYLGNPIVSTFGFVGLTASICWGVWNYYSSLDTSNMEKRLYYDFYHQLEAFIKKIWRATAPPEYNETDGHYKTNA